MRAATAPDPEIMLANSPARQLGRLVEPFILVALLGISAAVVVPNTINYAKRLDAQAVISERTAAYRGEVERHYETTGRLPSGESTGPAVGRVSLNAGGVVRYALNDFDQIFRGAFVELVPIKQAEGLHWTCRALQIPSEAANWLPEACRGGRVWTSSPPGTEKASRFGLSLIAVAGTLAGVVAIVFIVLMCDRVTIAFERTRQKPAE